MTYCTDCQTDHMGTVPCGGFAARLRTVSLSGDATPTRAKRGYYDREAITEDFGEDSRERLLDETEGLGPVDLDAEGNAWHQDYRTKERKRVGEETVDRVLLGGAEADG